MNTTINKLIRIALVLYIGFMSFMLMGYMLCFFIDKFPNDLIKFIPSSDEGYLIKLMNLKFQFQFTVGFGYISLLLGGFFIPQLLIVFSSFVYLRFMNGRYSPSVSLEKLQILKKLVLIAYILGSFSIETTGELKFSLTENALLLLALFILEKDVIITKNLYEKSKEDLIKKEMVGLKI